MQKWVVPPLWARKVWWGLVNARQQEMKNNVFVFSPRAGFDTLHQLSPYLAQLKGPKVSCATRSFTQIDPYLGISDPKNTKNPELCKLIHSVEANPLIEFYEPVGSTNMFQIRYHLVYITAGSYGQKTAIGQFLSNFSRAPNAKTVGRIRKS